MNDLFTRIIRTIKSLFEKKVEQAEDPVLLAEQNIRDLKADLSESLKSLAEVKAYYLRAKHEQEAQMRVAAQYEQKAVLLLEKARNGALSQAEADRLAMQALAKKDEILRRAQSGEKNLQTYAQTLQKLEQQTLRLKMQIDRWESEIKSLKARAQVSRAARNLQERLSRTDAQNMNTLLENLKEKVSERETLAEAYAQIAKGQSSLDEEIDRILASPDSGNISESQKLQSQSDEVPFNSARATRSDNVSFADELTKLKKRFSEEDKDRK